MEKIIIEKLEHGYNVIQGDKYSDQLGWDEMIGLVSTLTMPKERIHLQWMKTKEEHEASKLYNYVPDNIKIYRCNNRLYFGDRLWIGFNQNIQALGYTSLNNGMFLVERSETIKEVQCKLIVCQQSELKAGDTAYCSRQAGDFDNLMNYMKVLKDGGKDFVWIEDDESISVCTEFDDDDYIFYKVIPL